MIAGYGYRRLEADLKAAGAETIWIDVSRERPEFADMMREGGLREGDTLILFSLKDISGSGKEIARFQRILAERGITVDVRQPEKTPGKIGRPRKFDPDPEQDARIREIWLEPFRPGSYKLRRASEIMGHEVKRAQLYHRYGSVENPK